MKPRNLINTEKTPLLDDKAQYKNIIGMINQGKLLSSIDFKNAYIYDLDNARQIHAAFKKLGDKIVDVNSIPLPVLLRVCQRKSTENDPTNSYFSNLFTCWCRVKKEDNADSYIERPDSPTPDEPPKRKASQNSDEEYYDANQEFSSSPGLN